MTILILHFLSFIFCTYSDLSALLDRHSAALPLRNLAALLVRDLATVRLGHVAAVVDGDGLAVLAWGECYLVRSSGCYSAQLTRAQTLALAVGGQQHVAAVAGLTRLHIICK